MKPWLKEICDQVEDGTALPARIDDALAVFRRWGFDEDAPLFTMAGELVAMLIERCEQQDAELSRLRTLEASLPKTADGVTITRGMIIWRASEANESYEVDGMRLYDDDDEWWLTLRDCRGWSFPATTVYSTLEAAEKSREA